MSSITWIAFQDLLKANVKFFYQVSIILENSQKVKQTKSPILFPFIEESFSKKLANKKNKYLETLSSSAFLKAWSTKDQILQNQNTILVPVIRPVQKTRPKFRQLDTSSPVHFAASICMPMIYLESSQGNHIPS